MQSIPETEAEIIEEFSLFDDWMDKYEYIIELGKSLPLIDEKYKDDAHLIKGCQSRVWIHAEAEGERVIYTADSDAIITRGIVALLVRVLSGQKASDVAVAELGFIDRIGLKEHLTPTRSNGLLSMIRQMKAFAAGLHTVKG